jgi:hypothetical protein
MLVDWPKLIFALVLILTPIGLFHGKRVKYRALMRDWDGYWLRTLGLELHAIDLVRAALGAWLLFEAVKRAPDALGTMRYAAIITRAAILAISTVIQAVVCKESEAAHAPFAFVAGLVLGFLPPLVAGFALVLATALTIGAGFPSAFFPVLSVSVAATGFLFTGKKIPYELVTVAVAVAFPWLITLLFPRHFVCSYRARPKTVAEPPPR